MTQTFIEKVRMMDAAPELLDALKTARRALVVSCGPIHVEGARTLTVEPMPYIREALEVIDAALSKAEAK